MKTGCVWQTLPVFEQ